MFLAPILVAVLVAPQQTPQTPQATDSWPHLRGASYDGHATSGGLFARGPVALAPAWRRPLGPSYSGITVADGRVVTVASNGEVDALVALSEADGSELWRLPIGPTYLGHDGSEDGAVSTPTIVGDTVVVVSARGRLVVAALADGAQRWAKELVSEFGAVEPEYGFGTTPLAAGGWIIVQVGGSDGRALCAFDRATGEIAWSTASGEAGYASPVLMELAGVRQVVVQNGKEIFAVHPESGEVLWKHAFEGERDSATSGFVSPVDGDRFFAKVGGSFTCFRLSRGEDGAFVVEEQFRSRELRGSYSWPVAHDGHVYGFTSDFLTCIDDQRGRRKWKSRPPGGRGLVLVDDRLVVFGALGSVVVVRATPDEYVEEARIQALDHTSYSWPSFANGRAYVRSTNEIACVRLVPSSDVTIAASVATPASPSAASESPFAEFLRVVEAAPEAERPALVEAFLAEQPSFPIVEESRVHLVYTGEAEDVAALGTMTSDGKPTALTRVAGTELWYGTFGIVPGGRWDYTLQVDYGAPISDPRNPRTVPPPRGAPLSEVLTADYPVESHWKELDGEPRGRVDTFQYSSEALGNERELKVWVPPGYDDGDQRYPLALVHWGPDWIEKGGFVNTLERVIGKSVRPIVVVFVSPIDEWWYESGGTRTEEYLEMLATELVPHLSERYRLTDSPADRVLMGTRGFGLTAPYGVLLHPEVFGKAVAQSAFLGDIARHAFFERLASGPKVDATFYVDWGRWESRDPDRGEDHGRDSLRLHDSLRAAGYDVFGGEVLDSHGWGSWPARTDDWLALLFPLE